MAFPSKQTVQSVAHRAQKAAALIRKEKKEIVVGEKTKKAIDAMVFEGKLRKEAAEFAGMSDETLRQMLLKPHVLAYLNQQQDVLRTSARPRALRKMVDLLDAKTERIQFESAKYLDGMDRPSHAVGATQVNVQVNNTLNVTPGYVLDLRPDGAHQIEHLEAHGHNGLEDQADVPEED
ncbi:hypothetical protein [Rhizobium leguminosarum]|uniref:hypothetical protein n=1 Tax=Rhizobium leguminosarum TaxID=384 RepID=UPI00103C0D9E|nr:hypothetical protein [Rhizobium leguminosarum]TBY41603.1 hypothetical protein E0H54_30910 [Rhizobium leguminosarum bv. viciae]